MKKTDFDLENILKEATNKRNEAGIRAFVAHMAGKMPMPTSVIEPVIAFYERKPEEREYNKHNADSIETDRKNYEKNIVHAADIAMRAGMPDRAIQVYESANYLRNAADLAIQHGRISKAVDIKEKLNTVAAADLALEHGLNSRAYDLYAKALQSHLIKGDRDSVVEYTSNKLATAGLSDKIKECYVNAADHLEQEINQDEDNIRYFGQVYAIVAQRLGRDSGVERVLKWFEQNEKFYEASYCCENVGQFERALTNYLRMPEFIDLERAETLTRKAMHLE